MLWLLLSIKKGGRMKLGINFLYHLGNTFNPAENNGQEKNELEKSAIDQVVTSMKKRIHPCASIDSEKYPRRFVECMAKDLIDAFETCNRNIEKIIEDDNKKFRSIMDQLDRDLAEIDRQRAEEKKKSA